MLFLGALCLAFVSCIVVFLLFFSLASFLFDYSPFFLYEWFSFLALDYITDFIFFSFVLSTQGTFHGDGHHFCSVFYSLFGSLISPYGGKGLHSTFPFVPVVTPCQYLC